MAVAAVAAVERSAVTARDGQAASGRAAAGGVTRYVERGPWNVDRGWNADMDMDVDA
jgi:hypothetical protein